MAVVANTKMELVIRELKEVQKAKKDSGFERGELKAIFEELSEKYGLRFNTVKTTYYKEVRNNPIDETENEVDRIEDTLLQNIQEIKDSSIMPYAIGEVVDVRVKNVVDYGAYVQTQDEHRMDGFIHISEVKRGYIENIRDYFSVADVFEARVKNPISNDRIEFSTKDLPLVYKNNNIVDTPSEIMVTPINADIREDETLADITTYLNGVVGVLSPKAKELLKSLINQHGLVKFTISMIEMSSKFENDLGLQLLQEIDKKIGECL